MSMTLNSHFGGNVKISKVAINSHTKRTPIEQARFVQRTLGTKVAAKYLRNRGWSIEGAMWILTGK